MGARRRPNGGAGLTGMLHLDCEAYLAGVARWRAERGISGWPDLPADRARALFRESRLSRRPPLPPMAHVEDRELPGRGGGRPMRILVPPNPRHEALPVALYFHGGGYVLGGIEESEDEARRIALEMGAIVVTVDYRKGPEHRFPAAVDDGYDALVWATHAAAGLGGDPQRLMIGGTSAGAGLAAAVARLAALENGPRVRLLYLLCPWLDLTMTQRSVQDLAEGYGLERADLDWFAASYLPSGVRDAPFHPLVSPVLHPVPRRMPPTVILIAECDPLRDEARQFARMLEQAGTPVRSIDAPGMIHGFNTLPHLIPAGAAFLPPVWTAMRALLGL